MTVQRSGADARLFADIIETDIHARPSEGLFRNLENALAISLGICSGLSGRF
jgi:hypothetical protein